jgi:hypothetical protein
MPDEMIANFVQNSGGVRAAAVLLSAHVLQAGSFTSDDTP